MSHLTSINGCSAHLLTTVSCGCPFKTFSTRKCDGCRQYQNLICVSGCGAFDDNCLGGRAPPVRVRSHSSHHSSHHCIQPMGPCIPNRPRKALRHRAVRHSVSIYRLGSTILHIHVRNATDRNGRAEIDAERLRSFTLPTVAFSTINQEVHEVRRLYDFLPLPPANGRGFPSLQPYKQLLSASPRVIYCLSKTAMGLSLLGPGTEFVDILHERDNFVIQCLLREMHKILPTSRICLSRAKTKNKEVVIARGYIDTML